jgi:hypothetical protein
MSKLVDAFLGSAEELAANIRAAIAREDLWSNGAWINANETGVKGYLNSWRGASLATAEEVTALRNTAFETIIQTCSELNRYKCCAGFAHDYSETVLDYSARAAGGDIAAKAMFTDPAIVRHLQEGFAGVAVEAFQAHMVAIAESPEKIIGVGLGGAINMEDLVAARAGLGQMQMGAAVAVGGGRSFVEEEEAKKSQVGPKNQDL